MLKTLARAAAFAALIASPALAQDWTGLYAGLNTGAGMANGQFSDGCYFCATDNNDNSFWFGGAQAGFNWQVGSAVFGPEVDFDWTSMSHKGVVGTDDYDYLAVKQKLTWYTSARLRAGVAVDNTLFYLAAGPVWGHVDAPGVEFCCGVQDTTPTATGYTFSESGNRTGMSGGVGIEVMLNDMWSVGGEYNYADFGSKTAVRAPATGSCTTTYLCEVHNNLAIQTARVAVNFHIAP